MTAVSIAKFASVHLSVNAGIEMMLKSSVRYEFSAFANFNSIKTIAGLEFKLIFGKAGNKNI